MNSKKMLMLLTVGYVYAAAENVITVPCKDIRVEGGYEFLVKDHAIIDKNKLATEEWTEKGVMKAYIEYDPPTNDSHPTVFKVWTGAIITDTCRSVNYTATLNEGSQKKEIFLHFVVKDDPEDTGNISWIIALGAGCFLVIFFILGLLACLWWRKQKRSQDDVTADSPEKSQSLSNEVEHVF